MMAAQLWIDVVCYGAYLLGFPAALIGLALAEAVCTTLQQGRE